MKIVEWFKNKVAKNNEVSYTYILESDDGKEINVGDTYVVSEIKNVSSCLISDIKLKKIVPYKEEQN